MVSRDGTLGRCIPRERADLQMSPHRPPPVPVSCLLSLPLADDLQDDKELGAEIINWHIKQSLATFLAPGRGLGQGGGGKPVEFNDAAW